MSLTEANPDNLPYRGKAILSIQIPEYVVTGQTLQLFMTLHDAGVMSGSTRRTLQKRLGAVPFASHAMLCWRLLNKTHLRTY
jgi:hypothetical protein